MKRTIAAVLLIAVFAPPIHAQIYRWVDGKGVVSYTDNPASIPEPFRKRAVRVDEPPPPFEEIVIDQKKEGDREGEAIRPKKEGKETKSLLDGKDEAALKRDVSRAAAEVADIESQLAGIDERISQKEKLSRGEFVTLQNSRKVLEIRLRKAREKQSEVTEAARRAGVTLEGGSGGGN